MQFHEYDVVEVIAKVPKERLDQSLGQALEPKIGDVGTILMVHSVLSGHEPAFIVESVGDNGQTLWVADLMASELRFASTARGGT